MNSRNNPIVGSAAADIAIERVFDLCVRGIRIFAQQGDTGEEHAGRAIAALQSIAIYKTLLKRMETTAFGKTLYGRDFTVANCATFGLAGTRGRAAKKYCAGAALIFAATILRSGQIQFVAEHPKERALGICLDGPAPTVDHEVHALSLFQSIGVKRSRFVPFRPASEY
jgi:hypothetical protein